MNACHMPGAGDVSVSKIDQKFMLCGGGKEGKDKISKTDMAERRESGCCGAE